MSCQAKPPVGESSSSGPGGQLPTRITPSVSPNRQQLINSKPLVIKSEHQETDVLFTKRDLKKWTTLKDREETSNQRINEKRFENKLADVVRNPDEVLDGVHIHREQKDCKVYVQNKETSDGTQEKLALIVDTKTGRGYLGSTLSEEEYSNLKETGELDFSDLKRDPQTLVMNKKSINEAEILGRAKEQGCLDNFKTVR